MLCGNFYSNSVRAEQSGGSPHCCLCEAPVEDLPHVVASCEALEEQRQTNTEELKQVLVNDIQSNETERVTLKKVLTSEEFNHLAQSEELLTQFAVNPTSFNLTNKCRVNINNAKLTQICKITRNLCYSI